MTNVFQNALQNNIPQALTRLASARHLPLAQLENPQLLLAPDVVAKFQHDFAALGPQGLIIFKQLIEAIQKSLSTAITSVFFLGCILMVLGFVVVLFLREIPLRKSHTAPVAETPTSGTNRSRALLGLTLALVAREAQKPDANPQILESLSNTVNGRYPHDWSDEQRGKAVAQEIIEPLSITLLASSIGNGEGHNHEASSVSSAKTAADANGMPSTDNFNGL